MSLLLLFVGSPFGSVPPVVTPADTHDGVWDERLYKKYQEQLRKQREQLARDERNDKQRKSQLRKELVRLYRGLPEEETKQALVEAKQPVKAKDAILPALEAASLGRGRVQQALIQEYKAILAREALRAEMDEEDELETIITDIL